MTHRKIAVFTTSDIQTTWPGPDRVLVATAHVCDRDVDIYSTGVIERAVSAGYEVYVMSSRKAPDAHDAWWLKLVPTDHISFGRFGKVWTVGACDPDFIQAWRELAAQLGFDPDTFRLASRLTVHAQSEMELWASRLWETAPDTTWMDYMDALYRHGVAGPADFVC